MTYPQATGFEVNGALITSWNDFGCNAFDSEYDLDVDLQYFASFQSMLYFGAEP